MIVFIARRLLQALPALFLSTIAIFTLIHLLPGDPAVVLAGAEGTPEVVEKIRIEFGLDQPLPVQYGVWIGHVLRGDLGASVINGFPVVGLIARRAPATLELAVASMLLTVLIAMVLGIVSAVRQGGIVDNAIRVFNGLALSIPGFWLAILLILLFALALGWLPPAGRIDPLQDPIGGLKTLILPAFTLCLHSAAAAARLVRSSMLEVLGEDYVRTARAKGQRPPLVVLRHALPNAMIPVVTVLAMHFGYMLGGAVITETVFAWPGVGRLVVESIGARDYAVIQGTLLLFAVSFMLVNLLTDILYGILDPRIRLSGGRAS